MRVVVALLVLATAAQAQLGGGGGTGNYPGSVAITTDGVPGGDCAVFELPSGNWQAPINSGAGCTLVPLGGSGSGGTPVLALASCTPLDGTTQVYLGAGGCADPNEPFAQVRVKAAATLGQLSCALSGTAGGGAVVTATLRAGTCGGLSDSAVTCVVSSGQATCDAGSGTVALTAGQCFALRITSSATFATLRALGCTLRVVG